MSNGGQKRTLGGISHRAWEHAADTAALATLQGVPGLPELTKMLIGATTEKSLRLLSLASSVRVSGTQFPRTNTLYQQACERLDVESPPELFVAQNPFLNAGATGADHPFIVINSAAVESFDDAELTAVLGHEVGHCLSGHVLFKTLLQFLLRIPFSLIRIPAAGVALMAVIAALNEWDRKSELSADRAGILAAQEPESSFTLLMKMAGGTDHSQMSLDAFLEQAREYEKNGNLLDSVHKILNVQRRSHPFPVARLSELKSWVDAGHYQRILDGEYPRKGDSDDVKKAWTRAQKQYRDDIRTSKDPLSNAAESVLGKVDDMVEQVKDIFGPIFGKK